LLEEDQKKVHHGKICKFLRKCNRCCERKHKRNICRKCCLTKKVCRKTQKALLKVERKVQRISKELRKAHIVRSKKVLKMCRTYTRCGCAGRKRHLHENKRCCRKVNVCKKYIYRRKHVIRKLKKCCRFVKVFTINSSLYINLQAVLKSGI